MSPNAVRQTIAVIGNTVFVEEIGEAIMRFGYLLHEASGGAQGFCARLIKATAFPELVIMQVSDYGIVSQIIACYRGRRVSAAMMVIGKNFEEVQHIEMRKGEFLIFPFLMTELNMDMLHVKIFSTLAQFRQIIKLRAELADIKMQWVNLRDTRIAQEILIRNRICTSFEDAQRYLEERAITRNTPIIKIVRNVIAAWKELNK